MAANTTYPSLVVEEVTSWDDMPVSPLDGQAVMFMGMKWQYDGTASIWVPAWVYGETLLDVGQIVGDEANDAALVTNGWAITKAGAGATSYDGTRVKFDSSGANANFCNALFPHGGNQASHYIAYGRVNSHSYTGSVKQSACVLANQDGTEDRTFMFRYDPANAYNSFAGSGSTFGQVNALATFFATERFFLAYWRPHAGSGIAQSAWVEGAACLPSPTSFYAGTGMSGTAVQRWYIGDCTGNAAGSLSVRNLVVARY